MTLKDILDPIFEQHPYVVRYKIFKCEEKGALYDTIGIYWFSDSDGIVTDVNKFYKYDGGYTWVEIDITEFYQRKRKAKGMKND